MPGKDYYGKTTLNNNGCPGKAAIVISLIENSKNLTIQKSNV
ncbi:hypothetical protein SAMN05444144_11014 [Flavobacterium akiainvivens]|nr:hypothetical protein SAMN05444144_11014 [Flavobacterium akiainvivens]